MVRCGRPWWSRVWRLIAADAGCGSRAGAGHGFRTNPGVGLLIITDAGSFITVRGYGGPVRPTDIRDIGRCGRPRMCPSSVSAAALASVSDSDLARSAGCRLGRVTASIPGTAVTGRTTTWSTSRISTTFTMAPDVVLEALLRFAPVVHIPTCAWPRRMRECVAAYPPFQPGSSGRDGPLLSESTVKPFVAGA